MPTVQLFLDSSEALSGGTLEAHVYGVEVRKNVTAAKEDTSLCLTSAHDAILPLLTTIFLLPHSPIDHLRRSD